MQRIAVLVMAAVLTIGCTTMRPVLEPRERIAEQIHAGTLLEPGDRIRVMTDTGGQQKLRVMDIRSDGTIVGRRSEVRVDEIASLEKRERSWVKTGVLLGVAAGLIATWDDCEGPSCDEGFIGPLCCS